MRGTTGAALGRLARGGTQNLVGAIVQGLCGFLIVVLVTRGLGAERAGAFLIAVAVFNIVSTLARLGADVGLVRFVSSHRALGREHDLLGTFAVAVMPVAAAGLLAGTLLLVTADEAARMLAGGAAGSDLAIYLRVLAPFVPVAALYSVLIVATRGFGTMKPAVLVEKIGRPLVQVLAVAAVIGFGARPAWLALAWAGPFALAAVPTLLWLRQLPRRLTPGSTIQWREFWSFTAPRGLAGAFQVGLLWADTLLIGLLATATEAGIYAAATRYLLIGQFVQLAVVDVVQPAVSAALASGKAEDAQRVYQTGTTWQMALAWPAYLTLVVSAPVFLGLFGPPFAAGAPALVILGLAMLVATGCGPVDAVLLMGGRSALSLANIAVAFALDIGLNLLLIPRLGITGAAMAWMAALTFRNVAGVVQVRRFMGLHPFGPGWKVIAVGALALFGGWALAVRAVLDPAPALVLALLTGAAAYGAVVWRYRSQVELGMLVAAVRRASGGGAGR